MDHAAERRERLRPLLPQESVDGLLISNPSTRPISPASPATAASLSSTATAPPGQRSPLHRADRRRVPRPGNLHSAADAAHRRGVRRSVEETRASSVGFESGGLTVAEYENLRELAPTVDWKASPIAWNSCVWSRTTMSCRASAAPSAWPNARVHGLLRPFAIRRHRDRIVRCDGSEHPSRRRTRDQLSAHRGGRRRAALPARALQPSSRCRRPKSYWSIGARRGAAIKAT